MKKSKKEFNVLEALKNISSMSRRNILIEKRKFLMLTNNLQLKIELANAICDFKSLILTMRKILHGFPILDSSFLNTGMVEDYDAYRWIEKSRLWNGMTLSYPVDNPIFIARFVDLMLDDIWCNLDDIIGKEQKYWKKENDVRETLSLVYQMTDCISNLIDNMVNKNTYREEMLKVFELSIMIDDGAFKKKRKRIKVIEREVRNLVGMFDTNILEGQRPPDYIILQNVSLLAFILTTGSLNVKRTFMVQDDVTLKDSQSVKSIVEVLGSCIIEQKRREETYTTIYRWFLYSLPKISYKFRDINFNQNLVEGCRALSFLSFFANDNKVSKFIEKMIY